MGQRYSSGWSSSSVDNGIIRDNRKVSALSIVGFGDDDDDDDDDDDELGERGEEEEEEGEEEEEECTSSGVDKRPRAKNWGQACKTQRWP